MHVIPYELYVCTFVTGTYHNVTSRDIRALKIARDTTRRRDVTYRGMRDAWLECTLIASLKRSTLLCITESMERPSPTEMTEFVPRSSSREIEERRETTRDDERRRKTTRDFSAKAPAAKRELDAYKYHVVRTGKSSEFIDILYNSQPVKFYDTGHWPTRYEVQRTEKRFAPRARRKTPSRRIYRATVGIGATT